VIVASALAQSAPAGRFDGDGLTAGGNHKGSHGAFHLIAQTVAPRQPHEKKTGAPSAAFDPRGRNRSSWDCRDRKLDELHIFPGAMRDSSSIRRSRSTMGAADQSNFSGLSHHEDGLFSKGISINYIKTNQWISGVGEEVVPLIAPAICNAIHAGGRADAPEHYPWPITVSAGHRRAVFRMASH
jgi:hypothetical protein